MLKKLCLCFAVLMTPASAQDKAFTLGAPETLSETGLLKHILPRFSLKTGIRITLQASGGEARFGATGTPVFRNGETVWFFDAPSEPDTNAFLSWLQSDVGKRTIDTFAPDGTAMFSSDVSAKTKVITAVLSGDKAIGEKVSLSRCGRCHVVNETNRMNAIGSSPSFALLRSFSDWQERFETFFLLKPHPAFTQVEDVTEPFADHLPSPIAPVEVTLDEIEAITAYVGSIAPADLGAPIKSQ